MRPFRDLPFAFVCLRLGAQLVRRDFQKYAPIVLAIFAGRLGPDRWRIRLVRATYLYFRYLDDVADLDRTCGEEPCAFLERHVALWCNGPAATRPAGDDEILFRFIWNECDARHLPLHRARFLALRILDGLKFDVERIQSRRVVRQSEIDEYYANVVLAPACFAHVVLDGHAAPGALRDISNAIGVLQSFRDLEDDWRAGRINFPSHLLRSEWQGEDRNNWRVLEVARAAERLRNIWARWPDHADRASCDIMRPVVTTLLRWAAQRYCGGSGVAVVRHVSR